MMIRLFIAIVATFIWSLAALADSTDEFYLGKRISIIVGSSPGSAYDAYGQLVSRYLGKYIPGAPSFVVQDMPGAGGAEAANHLYNIAQKDGTVIAELQRQIPVAPLLESRNIQNHFDARKFNWLGSLNSEVGLIVAWHTAPQRTFEDLLTNELLIGSTGPSTDFMPIFLNKVLNTKMKIVAGYPSSADVYNAMERGEVEGRVSNGWSGDKQILSPWLKDGKVRFLVALATEKSSLFPDLPIIVDFAKTPADRKVMELLLSAQAWGRPFALPPGVPADRVAMMRKAFAQMMNDPGFLTEAKSHDLDIDILTGDAFDAGLDRAYAAPQEIVDRARQAIGAN